MNACEAEILELTKYKPKKKYKSNNEYLICLLREVDALPPDKFETLLSEQVYDWYKRAETAFKAYKALPELPTLTADQLAYPTEGKGTPDVVEHQGKVQALIDAHAKVDAVLEELQQVADEVRPERNSQYRKPTEGAKYYLNPEVDRYGLIKGGQRQRAAVMFERGATMKEIKGAFGQNMYNLLKKLKANGHKVTNTDTIITLRHKDDM